MHHPAALPPTRPPIPRPFGALWRMLDRAAELDAFGGVDTRSINCRSTLLIGEYRRLMRRYGEAAVIRHADRISGAVLGCLDHFGP